MKNDFQLPVLQKIHPNIKQTKIYKVLKQKTFFFLVNVHGDHDRDHDHDYDRVNADVLKPINKFLE